MCWWPRVPDPLALADAVMTAWVRVWAAWLAALRP